MRLTNPLIYIQLMIERLNSTYALTLLVRGRLRGLFP